MGVAVAVEKGAGMAEASLRQDPLLTDYICCISMLFLMYFFNDRLGDLTGFRARSHICDHSNNKPPCKLAISCDIANC